MNAEQIKEAIEFASLQIEKRQQALNDKRTKLKLLQKEIEAIKADIKEATVTRDFFKRKDISQ